MRFLNLGRHRHRDGVPADDIVIFEVMAEDLDQAFWRSLRTRLQADLAQSEIIVRAQPVDIL